MENIKKMAKIW